VYVVAELGIGADHHTIVDIQHVLKGRLLLTINQLASWNPHCIGESANIVVKKVQLDLGFSKFCISCNYIAFSGTSEVLEETVEQNYTVTIVVFKIFRHERQHSLGPGT